METEGVEPSSSVCRTDTLAAELRPLGLGGENRTLCRFVRSEARYPKRHREMPEVRCSHPRLGLFRAALDLSQLTSEKLESSASYFVKAALN